MNLVEIAKRYEQDFIKDTQGLLQIDSTLIEQPKIANTLLGKEFIEVWNTC